MSIPWAEKERLRLGFRAKKTGARSRFMGFCSLSLLATAVLGVAVYFQLGRDIVAGAGRTAGKLGAVLPESLAGWQSRELEIGSSEMLIKTAERVLRFDDYVYREYRKGDRIVSIYVAYWRPGRAAPREIAMHTPDQCWTANGWACREQRHAIQLGGYAPQLAAGEWRLFSTPAGESTYVQFWHLVGGEVYDHGERLQNASSAWRVWRVSVKQALKGLPEQYFIRLTSNRDFETLAAEPGWTELVAALGRLGLDGEGTR